MTFREEKFEDMLKREIDALGDQQYLILQQTVKHTLVEPRADNPRKVASKEVKQWVRPLVLKPSNAGVTAQLVQKYESKGWPVVAVNLKPETFTDDDSRLHELWQKVRAVHAYTQPFTPTGKNSTLEKYAQAKQDANNQAASGSGKAGGK